MTKEKKIKLYLDTSVPSAYYDASKPIRQIITQKWFENNASSYELYISVTSIEEIDKFENVVKKENIRNLLFDYNMKVLELSKESVILAEEYVKGGAIPKSESYQENSGNQFETGLSDN